MRKRRTSSRWRTMTREIPFRSPVYRRTFRRRVRRSRRSDRWRRISFPSASQLIAPISTWPRSRPLTSATFRTLGPTASRPSAHSSSEARASHAASKSDSPCRSSSRRCLLSRVLRSLRSLAYLWKRVSTRSVIRGKSMRPTERRGRRASKCSSSSSMIQAC